MAHLTTCQRPVKGRPLLQFLTQSIRKDTPQHMAAAGMILYGNNQLSWESSSLACSLDRRRILSFSCLEVGSSRSFLLARRTPFFA